MPQPMPVALFENWQIPEPTMVFGMLADRHLSQKYLTTTKGSNFLVHILFIGRC